MITRANKMTAKMVRLRKHCVGKANKRGNSLYYSRLRMRREKGK